MSKDHTAYAQRALDRCNAREREERIAVLQAQRDTLISVLERVVSLTWENVHPNIIRATVLPVLLTAREGIKAEEKLKDGGKL